MYIIYNIHYIYIKVSGKLPSWMIAHGKLPQR